CAAILHGVNILPPAHNVLKPGAPQAYVTLTPLLLPELQLIPPKTSSTLQGLHPQTLTRRYHYPKDHLTRPEPLKRSTTEQRAAGWLIEVLPAPATVPVNAIWAAVPSPKVLPTTCTA